MSFEEQNSFCIDAADIEEAQAILARVRSDLAKVQDIQREASNLASRKIVSAAGRIVAEFFPQGTPADPRLYLSQAMYPSALQQQNVAADAMMQARVRAYQNQSPFGSMARWFGI